MLGCAAQSKSPAMVRIEGGTFLMGSPLGEPGRHDDEAQSRITVSSFYMGKHPVTVGEFRRFVNATDYLTDAEIDGGGYVLASGEWGLRADANWRNPYFNQRDDHPVVLISWFDAIQYCNWLSIQEGLTPVYEINGENVSWDRSANGFRLPTEAEWEFACRAGTITPFNTGHNITTDQANYDGNLPFNMNARGEYRGGTTPVGNFAPNYWGLYDMHGNVWEWCWNWYGDYAMNPLIDPIGPPFGEFCVVRGGSWVSSGQALRSAFRGGFYPIARYSWLGFRVVRSE